MHNELDLQLTLINLQREVAALKTAKKAGLIVSMYNYRVNSYNYAVGLHKITYADGNQQIINTKPNSSPNLTYFTPVGNEQYFYWTGGPAIAPLQIQSTRQILNVEWVHA